MREHKHRYCSVSVSNGRGHEVSGVPESSVIPEPPLTALLSPGVGPALGPVAALLSGDSTGPLFPGCFVMSKGFTRLVVVFEFFFQIPPWDVTIRVNDTNFDLSIWFPLKLYVILHK